MTASRQEFQTPRRPSIRACALVMALLLPAPLPAAGTPEITSSAEVARAGYYQLRWTLDGADVEHYRVEEAKDPDFRDPAVLYEGADRATVVSGRGDGTFHYRVRATLGDGAESRWSDTITVDVAHHSLAQALGLFALGAVVFLATAGLIVAGNRAERRMETER